jgi:hypothetical protein
MTLARKAGTASAPAGESQVMAAGLKGASGLCRFHCPAQVFPLSTRRPTPPSGTTRMQQAASLLRHRRLIVAETALLASIVTVQVRAVPLHAPPQPANTPLPLVVTVSVTPLPLPNVELQVLPQLMPAGLLVTTPLLAALPLRVTDSANVGPVAAATVKGNVPDEVPPGSSTETWAVPAAAMSAAGMAAVNRVALT